MTREKDWIDVMRSELRDAEVTPPPHGWERLQRELAASRAGSARGEASVRKITDRPVKRAYWPRVVAAAAAVLVCVVAGELLWHKAGESGDDGAVLMTAAGDDSSAEMRPEDSPAVAARISGEENLSRTGRMAEHNARPLPERLRNDGVSLSDRAETPQPAADPIPRKTVCPSDGASSASSDSQRQAPSPAPSMPGAQTPASQAATEQEPRRADDAADSRTRAAADRARRGQTLAADADTETSFVPVAAGEARRKTSVGLFAAGRFAAGNTGRAVSDPLMASDAGNSLPGSNAYEINPLKELDYYDECSFRHHQPIGFGLTVRREFRHGLSVESGLVYTLLRSDVHTPFASDDISQQLHMLGVPLRMNWQFLRRGHFSLYIGAGGMAEKCLYAKFGSKVVTENGVQWSAFGVAGAEYRFGRTVGLYFEPELSYYFTRTELETERTENPLTLTFRLGMRFSF